MLRSPPGRAAEGLLLRSLCAVPFNTALRFSHTLTSVLLVVLLTSVHIQRGLLRTDLPPTHLSAKSGNFGAERVPERSQRSPMVQMKAESKTFNMAYHKIWICILGYD